MSIHSSAQPYARDRGACFIVLAIALLAWPAGCLAQPGGCCVEGTGDAWSAQPGAHDSGPCLPDQRCARHSNLTPCPPLRCGLLRKPGDPEGPVGVPHGWMVYWRDGVAYCAFGGEHRAQAVRLTPAQMTQQVDDAVRLAVARLGGDKDAVEKLRADSLATLERLCASGASCDGDQAGWAERCKAAKANMSSAFRKAAGDQAPAPSPSDLASPAAQAPGAPAAEPPGATQGTGDGLITGSEGGSGAPPPAGTKPPKPEWNGTYAPPTDSASRELAFRNAGKEAMAVRVFKDLPRNQHPQIYVGERAIDPGADTLSNPLKVDEGRYYIVLKVMLDGRPPEYEEFKTFEVKVDSPLRVDTFGTGIGEAGTPVDSGTFDGK